MKNNLVFIFQHHLKTGNFEHEDVLLLVDLAEKTLKSLGASHSTNDIITMTWYDTVFTFHVQADKTLRLVGVREKTVSARPPKLIPVFRTGVAVRI